MLTKTKKIRKNLKIENFEKTTDDGRTDDGRLRHDSSSADKVKQS